MNVRDVGVFMNFIFSHWKPTDQGSHRRQSHMHCRGKCLGDQELGTFKICSWTKIWGAERCVGVNVLQRATSSI